MTKPLKYLADGKTPALTKSEREKLKRTQRKAPVFTDAELQALHHDQRKAAWQPDRHYDARRSAVKKLDAYFGDDTSHIDGKSL